MIYEEPKQLTRPELENALNCDDPSKIGTALTSAALYDSDRVFVEGLIIKFLQHQDPWVRGVAAIAAGHVARIHHALSVETILPLINDLLADPRTSGKAQDAIDDVDTFVTPEQPSNFGDTDPA